MADVTIGNLSTTSVFDEADKLIVEKANAGGTRAATYATLKTYLVGNQTVGTLGANTISGAVRQLNALAGGEGGSDNVGGVGAGAHNANYRGRNLGGFSDTYRSRIADGTFTNMFIGDYFVINSVKWRIAAFDYYYGMGSTHVADHHIVIVPDTILGTGNMNDKVSDADTTDSGYWNSKMKTTNLSAAATTINNAFKVNNQSYVLTHKQLVCTSAENGLEKSTAWNDVSVILMTEANVFGTFVNVIGSTTTLLAKGSTLDARQFPLFTYAPEFITANDESNHSYWLRDVASSTAFSAVAHNGLPYTYAASESQGIRPCFCVVGTAQT